VRNAFLPHEDDFAQWAEGGFLPSTAETRDYLAHPADPGDERRPKPGGLWPHQWEALLRALSTRARCGGATSGRTGCCSTWSPAAARRR